MQIHPAHGYGHPPAITPDERNMAMLCHLLSILTGFIGPLILWLVKKDESPFINHHGREALNFQITIFFAYLALFGLTMVLMIVFIGVLLIPLLIALPLLALVAEIMACMAANRGEWHRYPCCLRLF
ncbi:DUF4870 domain-containing protein [Luteolibacter sp. SL250]|uniref:DUF4870 domain-containing protein n=1 Tax=Luteolibacter sp. SL250 TaxID=2995170 RepID=UPI00226D4B2E|nr:DUF4870 domain-containing protein [Luteolibacter sp. SL250]WAC18252.1 DUF4870 domain-containing protein [Luteolibacter sp. SL250]